MIELNYLLNGGVSLSISLNLKLAPVPYATLIWPIGLREPSGSLFRGHRKLKLKVFFLLFITGKYAFICVKRRPTARRYIH